MSFSKWLFHILFLGLILTACNNLVDKRMETSNQMVSELEKFKAKPKFEKDTTGYLPYIGLTQEHLKPAVSELMNKVADDFIKVSKNKEASEKKYQDKIEIGLSRFTPLYIQLDTEDRERVCYYFEELMNIVGLESSGGHLNEWMYGFDPEN